MTRRRRTSLTVRLVLVTTTVAAVAVLVAGLVSVRLATTAAQNQARSTLGRQADIAAGLTDQAGIAQQRPALARAFRIDRISLVRVTPRGRLVPVDGDGVVTDADAQRLLGGGSVSDVRRDATGKRVFVEGRAADNGAAVVLWQPARVARGATRS